MNYFFNKADNICQKMLFVVLLLIGNSVIAQQSPTVDDFSVKNAAYLELGGNGFWYSLNYDRVFIDKQSVALTGRVGLAYMGNLDTNTFSVPLACNFLVGQSKNFLEIGLGSTILLAVTDRITGLGAFGIIGYRHQPMMNRGLVFRLSFTPFIGETTSNQVGWKWFVTPFGGVSIGYAF